MAELTITRSFAAPREAVFDAWTNPEKFAVWFGTDGVDVPAETLSMDVRPGGSWKAVMKLPDDTSISWVGEYLEVDAPSHLVMTITDNPALDARGVITVDLSEVGDGTEMIMSQESPGFDQGQLDQTAIGYNAFFDVMGTLVAESE
ncbi:SRPBCC domain-containing protein [Agreia sp. PsM10]|uniref:SRPBCC family protein n=1 Tax=Agreia sp. PsM10 TaxID=3030533 RepID=UPI00263B53C2|nr:SRPBCC domain-containing protein [Agreia sp. PsM10]MDN4639144.1 SRPBCC domain-containing protein [Agreia sp. PsM10]